MHLGMHAHTHTHHKKLPGGQSVYYASHGSWGTCFFFFTAVKVLDIGFTSWPLKCPHFKVNGSNVGEFLTPPKRARNSHGSDGPFKSKLGVFACFFFRAQTARQKKKNLNLIELEQSLPFLPYSCYPGELPTKLRDTSKLEGSIFHLE